MDVDWKGTTPYKTFKLEIKSNKNTSTIATVLSIYAIAPLHSLKILTAFVHLTSSSQHTDLNDWHDHDIQHNETHGKDGSGNPLLTHVALFSQISDHPQPAVDVFATKHPHCS